MRSTGDVLPSRFQAAGGLPSHACRVASMSACVLAVWMAPACRTAGFRDGAPASNPHLEEGLVGRQADVVAALRCAAAQPCALPAGQQQHRGAALHARTCTFSL